MVALRESPARVGFRALAPIGQLLGEPRFRWRPHTNAWLYRVDLSDAAGRPVAKGWSGMPELPLAWLHDGEGMPPRLTVGATYRWRVVAYKGRPDEAPAAAAPEAEFLYLGP